MMKKFFAATISIIQRRARDRDIYISQVDIASALNLSHELFNQYFVSDEAPEEVFKLLEKHFGEYLGTGKIRWEIKQEEIDLPDPDDE
ncbi:hypothetical protein SAMN05660909_03777 [Chitinophaga terrae (ex Kim and Jung 2007)]|uniref:XRE family transcriptional regulator n=1 Tax=Chitinophaga terrae (ex Kim and Jung 2007) TaxID=408074 RepID=A0A1H4EKC0_9BACT|nr:hypothetical protein [Chitinophaga terrae (ex Kim and Jung 2007)]MDQ0107532.1 protein-arginine kinase [Chitinophaga terrae (ex Kim and Jung 2007)]GEP91684.1 hypothetical protein CTE07_33290 [Chitinophaga terrae (ex Kim and Jung 2007)]SEA85475.1 hypothetical protein SAMN05660909_03777 [Chitinophaga terrae (ex Kim and Jung 2007)]